MKTQTLIGLAVLAALGVGAYYIYTKNKAATAATTVTGLVNSGTTAVGGIASLFSSLVSDIGGVFSSNGYGSAAGTASPITAQSQLDAYTAYNQANSDAIDAQNLEDYGFTA